jgi:hypothetical protein
MLEKTAFPMTPSDTSKLSKTAVRFTPKLLPDTPLEPVNKTVDNPIKIVDGTPQMSRRSARYRALTVAGLKRVAVGEQT